MMEQRWDIAVVGSGISGLSAAWLLSRRHRVTLFESMTRAGGHSNTVEIAGVPVDTGFTVFNEATCPNLTALLSHLEVQTKPSNMSFAVSLNHGAMEYAGTGLKGLFAQPRNLLRPRFWSMLADLRRFHWQAPAFASLLSPHLTLSQFLDANGYGTAFQSDHLLPLAAAIWSASAADPSSLSALHFLRFCDNHGLLKISGRPRTVVGGSRQYIAKLLAPVASTQLGRRVAAIRRLADRVVIRDHAGDEQSFDHVVLACHADQALALLDAPTEAEVRLLGVFSYIRNRAVLHGDGRMMPRRRAAWASLNYLSDGQSSHVTYWMNRLQGFGGKPLFLTLNPPSDLSSVLHEEVHEHPWLDGHSTRGPTTLWTLQGRRRTWFCGAYFGAGLHEDGLQSGLTVAEQLGGVRRPWSVAAESEQTDQATQVSILAA